MPFESKLANTILFTPLDSKCSVEQKIHDKLTHNEFLDKCYSFPIFSNEYQSTHKELNISNDIIDDVFDLSEEKIKKYMYKQLSSYNHFLQWLEVFNDNTNSKIYTISGNAGTGKTTFLNRLQFDYKNSETTNIEIIVLDVSKKNDLINWFGDNTIKIKKSNRADKKIFGAILKKINDMVFNYNTEDPKSIFIIYEKIISFLKNYNEFYCERGIKGEKFFDELDNIININERPLVNIRNAARHFTDFFTELDRKDDAYLEALDILLILLRCQYDENKKQFVIILDNLERFIHNHEIYSRDLNKIRDDLRSYQNTINLPNNHNYKFKFVMAVRCDSARMTGAKSHDDDALPNDIDVTQWYDISDIILKKENWYEDNGFCVPSCGLYNQIISDERITHDKKITGLKRFIEPLFNYNKRLIMDFIGEMEENSDYEDIFVLYREYWDDGNASSVSKFAARSLIKESLVRKLATCDNMFDYFLLYKGDSVIRKNDYARQILTLLYNKYNTEDDETMRLSEILNKMNISKLKMDKNEYKEALNDIASILFHMNSYNRRNNDWIQFIDLQFHNENNESIFINSKDELYNLMKTEKNQMNFQLVIMDAGIMYLQHIFTSYEFFSAMYCSNSKNIFALIPTTKELYEKNINDLQLYKSINTIYLKAEKRIFFLKENKLNKLKMYKSNNDRVGIDCIQRIINSHTAYLRLLLNLLEEEFKITEDGMVNKINQLYDSIDKIIEKYKLLNE